MKRAWTTRAAICLAGRRAYSPVGGVPTLDPIEAGLLGDADQGGALGNAQVMLEGGRFSTATAMASCSIRDRASQAVLGFGSIAQTKGAMA